MKLSFLLFCIWASAGACADQILIVGDSLSCGPFGQRLVQDLTQLNHKVDMYCAVSSAAANWVLGKNPPGQKCQTWSSGGSPKPCPQNGKVPPFSKLLKLKPYSEIIVALGTNSLLSPKADLYYAKMFQMIAASPRTCDWVSPPRLRPDQAKGFSSSRLKLLDSHNESFYQSLKMILGNSCVLHDSRPLTSLGTTGAETVDGVHRTRSAGYSWADALIKSF